MNATNASEATPSAASTPGPIRCHHRWPFGRRCRQTTEHENSSFCATHAAVEQNRHNGDRLSELLPPDNDLFSAKEVNASLFSLYLLLAQDRISPRRAAVLAYIASLMVRTFPAVEKEASPQAPALILDLPRPQPPADPEPDTHPVATDVASAPVLRGVAQAFRPEAVDVTPSVVAGLQTRASFPADDVILSEAKDLSLPRDAATPPTLASVPHPSLSSRACLPQAAEPRDLLFSPSPTSTTPPPPNPPSYPIYRDPNYDDHWHPTANALKTADELERQRFAPTPKSPHQDSIHDARDPVPAHRPAA